MRVEGLFNQAILTPLHRTAPCADGALAPGSSDAGFAAGSRFRRRSVNGSAGAGVNCVVSVGLRQGMTDGDLKQQRYATRARDEN